MFWTFIKRNWILGFILILSLLLRVYQLNTYPSGFQGDEAAYGYNAYAILKTGRDEYGKFLLITLKSFEDYKPAVYSYLTIPFVATLGLTEVATRLPAALFGVATVGLLYFFVLEITKRKNISLLSSFLLAISPWHIMLSRSTSEVIVSLFFLLLLSFSLIKMKDKMSWTWISLGIISSVLAFSSYTASRFYVLIIIGIFFVLQLFRVKKDILKKPVYIYLL